MHYLQTHIADLVVQVCQVYDWKDSNINSRFWTRLKNLRNALSLICDAVFEHCNQHQQTDGNGRILPCCRSLSRSMPTILRNLNDSILLFSLKKSKDSSMVYSLRKIKWNISQFVESGCFPSACFSVGYTCVVLLRRLVLGLPNRRYPPVMGRKTQVSQRDTATK